MEVESSIKHKAGSMQGTASCSVCLEGVNEAGERSIAKLTCGHQFHLDCIGSAFNVKGTMQCPNCRNVENGHWLYANGCHQREESMAEDIMIEDEYEFTGVSELIFPHDLLQWCPYQSSYTQFSLSLGDSNHPPATYADLVVNVHFGEGSLDSSHTCPFLQLQGPRLSRLVPVVEENVGMSDIALNPHRGATVVANHGGGQHLPQQGRWAQQNSTPLVVPGGLGTRESGSISMHHRPRVPRSDFGSVRAPGVYQRAVDMATNGVGPQNMLPRAQNHNFYGQGGSNQIGLSYSPFNISDSRRGRVQAPIQAPGGRPAHYPAEGQMLPGPLNWDYFGPSLVHDAAREPGHRDGTAFAQWRQEGLPSFQQYPPEPEMQRWTTPPSSRMSGFYNNYGPVLSAQAGVGGSEAPFTNPIQGPFQAFPSSFILEPQVDTGSFQPPASIGPSR